MQVTLIESGRKSGLRHIRGGIPSLAIHGAIIGGAIFATLSRPRDAGDVPFDTTLILVAPPEDRPPPPTPLPQLSIPVKGFQTVSVPDITPTIIPAVSLQQHFDVKDFTGVGVEGGTGAGAEPDSDQVYEESEVDEPPRLLAAPRPDYPVLLRDAGIGGRVLLQAVVDTTGKVDPASVKVVQSPNPAFQGPSRKWLLKAQFRPARIRGRPVRVLVNIPLDFSITGGQGE